MQAAAAHASEVLSALWPTPNPRRLGAGHKTALVVAPIQLPEEIIGDRLSYRQEAFAD
jgi:hypothetical protein